MAWHSVRRFGVVIDKSILYEIVAGWAVDLRGKATSKDVQKFWDRKIRYFT